MKHFARWLLTRLQRHITSIRPPDFQVIREGSDVYLRRWWVIRRNSYFNIYLHHMLRDDDAILHDHPYVSLSLILTDGLCERYCLDPQTEGDIGQRTQVRTLRAGQLVYRSSRMAHQILVEKPAWTLFMTGPRIRDWGFWCPHGFRPWQDYVGAGQDSALGGLSGKGRGCGEL